MNKQRVITSNRLKVIEIDHNIFAAISPYRGISWANAAFINRGKGLVYDTFFDLFHAQELKDIYTQVSNQELPQYVVNSHYNSDHTWGNKVFKDSCIIMHKNAAQERLTENIQWFDTIIKRGKDSLASSTGERFFAKEFEGFDLTGVEWITPDIEITSNTTLHLDTTEVQLIDVAPSHSNSDVLLWLEKERILFAGDVVFNGCTAYSEQGIHNWVKVLDYIIQDLKPKIVVPGHGSLCGVDFVEEQKQYLTFVLEQVDKHYTKGITAEEITKKIDISKYLHWIQPERIYMSILAVVKSKEEGQFIPPWNDIPASLTEVRAFYDQKYNHTIPTWDPYSSWNESLQFLNL